MSRDGRALETLVRQIEELFLPKGCSVVSNRRVYSDDGLQIAEFDLEIRGRWGSTDIAWLIECRDRPGQGPAPASWIEQLAGRRERFRFNKVTAVSSTGFAVPAISYASEAGIELRSVAEVTAADVSEWLGLTVVDLNVTHSEFATLGVVVDPAEPPERKDALARALRGLSPHVPILRSADTGDHMSPVVAFNLVVLSAEHIFEDVEPNGPARSVRLLTTVPSDGTPLVVDTDHGPVPIRELLFEGRVSIRKEQIPIASINEYRREGTGERIAQSAIVPFDLPGARMALEMHNLKDSGETHILLRSEAQ